MLGIDPRAARMTWTAALVLLALGVLYLIRDAVFVLIVAVMLGYLLYPMVDALDRYLPSKTRTLALGVTYLIFIGVLATLGTLVGSTVADQAVNLAKGAPGLVEKMYQTPPPGENGALSRKGRALEFVQAQIREHSNEIASYLPRISLRLLAASGNVIYLVIVPILSFFILRDGRRIRDTLLEIFGARRAAAEEVLMDIHVLLLQYMRALLILCCAVFAVFSVFLSVMKVPYALLLSTAAFALEFIPMVGPLIAAAIILGVSFLSSFPHILALLIFLVIYRLCQDYVLSPHLMSRGVELHPIFVIFGVLAGGRIGGISGIFLSIPVLALTRLAWRRLHRARAVDRRKAA